ncbi:MAG: hypothetical protein Q9M20_00030 [Mariprofundaceae bacterium]|nr:hypothetical protein [Mariprofundaceae bacterium]
MNFSQIESNLKKLISSFSKASFIYDLLLAYGLPKASITRLKKGNLNLSKVAGEISWKKKLFFKEEYEEDLHLAILSLKDALKQDQRFVVVTDYTTLLAIDTKTDDKLDIALMDLPKHYDFFLPWAGMEKAQHQNDLAIERCYRFKPFESDEERLEYLFKLYEKIIQEEQDKNTLFAKEKKTRKKRMA